jgi:60 kDa SS-A/Ro ribonucleoprotein
MKSNPRLQREHIPTQLMSSPEIWASLLEGMGMTALIRNLGKISSIGIMTQFRQKICAMLTNQSEITKTRIHPIQVLIALKTYMAGKGDLGKLTWTTDGIVLDTLSTTFKMSFGNVERTGKRIMIALDVSGSMDCATAGAPSVTCREGATAMAMATLAAEGDQNTSIYAFTTVFKSMNGRIKPNMTVQEAIRATQDVFGGTDCALPMRHAAQHTIPVDCFIVYTDSETYAPTRHPQVELEEYRKKTGINAKMIVVGMVSNCLTIADPSDKNTLNLAGFDSSLPQLITMFLKDEI